MNIKLEFKVGRKKYKMYDYEAGQLHNMLSTYFDSVGAFEDTKAIGENGGNVREGDKEVKGFKGGI